LTAADSYKAVFFGHHEGGQLAAMLAASAPELVDSLILYATPISARAIALEEDPDLDDGAYLDDFRRGFMTRAFEAELFEYLAPSYRGEVSASARRSAGAGEGEITTEALPFVFEDVGEHELKGVPDDWRPCRVAG
jgi:pimeloyl-ACP methyl ester carboxylesterase